MAEETGPWTREEIDAALAQTACERCGRDWLKFAVLCSGEEHCGLYASAWCLERSVRSGS